MWGCFFGGRRRVGGGGGGGGEGGVTPKQDPICFPLHRPQPKREKDKKR